MSVAVPEFVEIGEAVIYQQLQEEAVLLDMIKQEYYGLDDVGTRMWQLLVDEGDVERVIGEVATFYCADPLVIRNDIHMLIRELIARNLLKARD